MIVLPPAFSTTLFQAPRTPTALPPHPLSNIHAELTTTIEEDFTAVAAQEADAAQHEVVHEAGEVDEWLARGEPEEVFYPGHFPPEAKVGIGRCGKLVFGDFGRVSSTVFSFSGRVSSRNRSPGGVSVQKRRSMSSGEPSDSYVHDVL